MDPYKTYPHVRQHTDIDELMDSPQGVIALISGIIGIVFFCVFFFTSWGTTLMPKFLTWMALYLGAGTIYVIPLRLKDKRQWHIWIYLFLIIVWAAVVEYHLLKGLTKLLSTKI